MTERHSARARAALEAMVEADPALAALSLWCVHRDGAQMETRAERITYGPEFETLAPHEQIGLAAHHILHVALRHSARMTDMAARLGPRFDAARWNLAADALVNETVLLAGHALPRPAVTIRTLLAERGQTKAPAEALATWDVERLYHALGGAPGQGQGAQRAVRRDLHPARQAAGAATEEAALWRQHMARALQAGRQAGRGLGRIGHRIADIPEPRTPWELVLRGLLARALTALPQPTPLRPARRWLAASAQARRAGGPPPGFEPGQRSRSEVPRIAVGLDASGSIDAPRLALFWAEVLGIARRLRAEVLVMVFDEEVRHVQRLAPAARPDLPALPRGGGTAFAPVIARAEAERASVLVLLTDLEGDPGPKPALPVIWATPDGAGRSVPFGRVLDLSR